jgi:sugar phosphate isomerase/epimerase
MMTRQLIVHQLNATGVSPAEFIRIVAANGVDQVTLFTYDGGDLVPRTNTGLSYPQPVTQANKRETLDALAETGVTVDGVEFFPLTEAVDLNSYAAALAIGAEIGATRASSHIFITDDGLVIDKLGKLCDLAKAQGISRVSSEFCPLTAGNPSIQRGKWLVDQLGRADFGIGMDALHAVRSGCTAADIAALDPRYFGITQICDAIGAHVSSDYVADAHRREVPGQGDLPLVELFNAVPAAIPIEIETPAAHRRAAGVSAAEHVRDVIAGTRKIVEKLAPSR